MTEPLGEGSARLLAGQLVQRDIVELARAAVDRQILAYPQMRGCFSGDRYVERIRDTERPLTALAQALLSDEPWLFESYVIWAKIALGHVGLPDEYLFGSLEAIRVTILDRFVGAPGAAAAEFVDGAVEALLDAPSEKPKTPETAGPLAEFAVGYLDALLVGDRAGALRIVRGAEAAGAVLPDIYEHVFRVTQHEVGRLWQTNRLSVAMEHYTTGATEAIMAQLAIVPRQTPHVRSFLGASVEGEQHDLAIRMVCDLLESEGWETRFLGANTPQHVLLQSIEEFRPTVVGLSATWLFRVDNVRRIISQIHAQHPGVKVIIGGAPFDRVSGLAEKVGADARGGGLMELPALLQHLITPN